MDRDVDAVDGGLGLGLGSDGLTVRQVFPLRTTLYSKVVLAPVRVMTLILTLPDSFGRAGFVQYRYV